MKTADADILIVPGLGHSGPGHWQQRWVEKIRNARFVEQEDWDAPSIDDWSETLEREIMMATRPVVLVGHSLGVLNIVAANGKLADTKVKAAFLVSAPDVDEHPDVPEATAPFQGLPRDPLKFPSMLVASSNDPYCSIERAAEFASCWGSDFHIAGDAGHINVESGHGPWPEGLLMFTRLMGRI
ncbi:RBBP9/YdeN family alpha/beta hydrolase [Pelagibacterium lentulum]|uniref:Alpha/beta hydrolase n=1 Tax=Pelagibacterium lentulum TaxID=2029865 RepID=A0A916R9S9_9HYPH|nr:alpha/beta hydrolase [Pelagibacterium lentulum]GGA48131.1 alpha/beta hydrolase [Pelagibacterium lentulum]